MSFLTTLTFANGHSVTGLVLHQLRLLFHIYRADKLRAADITDFGQSWHEAHSHLPIVFFHPNFDERDGTKTAHIVNAIETSAPPTSSIVR